MISSLQERWEKLRSKLEEMEKCLTEEKILLASFEEKKNANLKTLERLNAAITEISNDIVSKTRESETLEKKIENTINNISLQQDYLDHLYFDHDTIEVELEKKRGFQIEKEELLRGKEMESLKIKKPSIN
jgi:chromosome segregation ATPase